MSTYNLADYANILRKRYDRIITDATTLRGPGNYQADQLGLFQPMSFMEFLRQNGRISIGGALDAGAKIWPVRSAGGSASSYTAEEAIPAATTDTYAQAEMAWSRTRNVLEIDNLALEVSRGERVVGDVDAFLVSYENKLKELFSNLEDQLAGNGAGNDMDGFRSFLSDSNTFAGINQATNAYWQATEVNMGGANVTRPKLNEVIRNMDIKGCRPTHILIGMTQAHKYSELFTSGIEYPGGANGQSHVLPSWQGIPIVVINTMNAAGRGWDEFFFVNVNDLHLEFVPFRGAPAQGVDANAQSYFGTPVGIDHEPTGKDKRQLVMKCYHRFYAKNPKKHGVLINCETAF